MKATTKSRRETIWSQLTAGDWLSFLEEFKPGNKWVESGGAIKGCCVFHNERTPSAVLNVRKRFYKCYGCDHYTTDPIAIVQQAANTSYLEAFHALKSRYGLSVGGQFTAQLQEDERRQRVKIALADAFKMELLNAVNAEEGDHMYTSAKRTIEWLEKRGVSSDYFHNLPIGVIPTTKRLRALVDDPTIIDDCIDYFSSHLKVDYLGALVFVYHENPHRIARFKVRVANTKKIYVVADEADETGFFGLGLSLYLPLVQQQGGTDVVVVEGEFDQLAFAVNQLRTGVAEKVVVSTGGSEIKSLDALCELGFTKGLVISDAPQFNGDTIIKGVLGATEELPLEVYQWSSSLAAKDPDEAINLKYDYERAWAHFTDKSNYKNPHIWVFSKVQDELKAIGEDDVRTQDKVIADWGAVLLNEGERSAYITAIAKDRGLSYTAVAKNILPANDSEMQYVRRIEDAILDVYEVLGEESNGSTSYLYVWNKRKELMRRLPLARLNEVEMELGKDVGIMSQWLAQVVGEPDFICYKPSSGKQKTKYSLLEKEGRLKSYILLAFKSILSKARNYAHLKIKGQGIHWLDFNGTPGVVVVNGKDAYQGIFAHGGGAITWTKIIGPAVGDYLLDLDDRYKWSNSIESVEDLTNGSHIDAKATFEKLVDILETGWKFRGGSIDAKFIAAQTLATPISNALRRQTYIFVTAEASSGKSRLTLGYFGGTQFPTINVMEHSVGMDDYTEAGFRQTMNNQTLLCCLDEFEDDGTNNQKSYEVRKILKVLRNIMGASNRILKGTPTGETKVYYLRFPVMMSAISTIREAADISRMITINMVTDRTRVDPIISIGEKYSEDDMELVRREVTLCLLHQVPELLENYKAIEKQYARGEGLPKGTQTRYREGLYPSLAVLKTIGVEYEDFAFKFCKSNAKYINKIASATENDEIFRAVLNSPNLRADIEGRASRSTSVGELLVSEDMRSFLNTTGCGVWYCYDSGKHLLLVNWTQAVQGVLSNHPKYKHERNAAHLKEMAERGDNVLSRDKLRRAGVITRVIGPTARLDDVTAYDISDMIEHIDSSAEEDADDTTLKEQGFQV